GVLGETRSGCDEDAHAGVGRGVARLFCVLFADDLNGERVFEEISAIQLMCGAVCGGAERRAAGFTGEHGSSLALKPSAAPWRSASPRPHSWSAHASTGSA